MQQIDLIRDCCNKHPISDIMNHNVNVKTLTWLASQVPDMLELIDCQAARITKLEQSSREFDIGEVKKMETASKRW